ncbi:ABC transporter permease [Jiella sp. MQZ9-1]|uniref:ABC transporter permease n=1 Tax=Jiella flava TaxID=2816857 RepID=A0A939FYL0_9HYPH|nr:ABC transporter permease [Jiella flava]MBO0664403.1 ABC transporter permease [Jiella flava]MCD2473038.1 ABC transporter permease [Jiella flava]
MTEIRNEARGNAFFLDLSAALRQRGDLLQRLSAVATLIALVIAFSMVNGTFLSTNNAMTILLQTAAIGLLGIGMTVVIITGGIDLSVGSVLALAGVTAGLLVKAGLPVSIGFAGGLIVGTLCGLVNGLVVTKLKIAPFIATLGMMLIARGIALQITGASPVSGLGDEFGRLGNGALFRIIAMQPNGFPRVVFAGIPYPAILLIVVAVAIAYLLHRRTTGRHVYAVGSNEEAARLSGVAVDRTKLFAYALSGFMAGLAGIVLMSRLVTAQPSEGVMSELDAIAAAVIGGASLMGGVGTISGTMIGAFIIGILRNGLNMGGVSAFIQQIVIGFVVIGAVWVDQLRHRKGS